MRFIDSFTIKKYDSINFLSLSSGLRLPFGGGRRGRHKAESPLYFYEYEEWQIKCYHDQLPTTL